VGNISDRKRVERESAEYLRQLRALSQRIETIREEERTWIAREIHDELGQALTGIRIDLGWLQGKLFPGQSVLEERTTSMIHLVDSTIAAIQRIAAELRPVLLDDFGLAPAIEWHAEEFQRRTGIRCVLDLVEDLERIPDSVATTVFRVFQEGLTNVARHARASSVHVTLSRRDGRLLLEVADDGCGVNPDVIASGRAIGIIGMRERVRALQGIFHLTGRPGEGTTIRIELPLDGGGTA
jgi:signal transduction histidine kinase